MRKLVSKSLALARRATSRGEVNKRADHEQQSAKNAPAFETDQPSPAHQIVELSQPSSRRGRSMISRKT